MKIGYLSFTDPAIKTAKQATITAEIEKVIASIFSEPSQFVALPITNDAKSIRAAIKRLCDDEKCPLVLTLGGNGVSLRDITPDITLELVDRKLPGFGEIMRYYSYERFKVSVLSRAEAGVRGTSLIINLPAKPKPLKFCLRLLQEGIAEALEQISGTTPGLRGDEVVIPMEKYLPFLKKIRPQVNPNFPEHPTLR